MAKRRIDRTINVETGDITFKVLESGAELVVNGSELSAAMIGRAVLHGLNGKIGDSAANPEVDALVAMTTVWDQLKADEWTARGTGAPRVTVLAEAVASVTGQDVGAVVDKLEAMSVEDRRELPKKYAKIKAAMDQIKADRAKAAAKVSDKAAKGSDEDLSALLS